MPTIYLSNWSSHKTKHGPGRKFTIMAKPREWEHGAGRVAILIPRLEDLNDVVAGRIEVGEYRDRYRAHVAFRAVAHDVGNRLAPGKLEAFNTHGLNAPIGFVEDGDTLCCNCSVDKAAAGKCHRVWAAALLKSAGWDVVLDGVKL